MKARKSGTCWICIEKYQPGEELWKWQDTWAHKECAKKRWKIDHQPEKPIKQTSWSEYRRKVKR